MDKNEYDRGKCQDFFQAYRDCKRAWVRLLSLVQVFRSSQMHSIVILSNLVGIDDAAFGKVERSTGRTRNPSMSARLQGIDFCGVAALSNFTTCCMRAQVDQQESQRYNVED